MASVTQLAAFRTVGVVAARDVALAYDTPEQFAKLCGLRDDAGIYLEVTMAEALALVANVLHSDLAYGVEIMSLSSARSLASEFLKPLESASTRYFTNGEIGAPRSHPNAGPTRRPATEATFDTGVIVLAPARSVCLWVQDED